MPLVRRTRATLRSAEFGFFGVFVYTRVHTPRRWGAPLRAGVLVLSVLVLAALADQLLDGGHALPQRRKDGSDGGYSGARRSARRTVQS